MSESTTYRRTGIVWEEAFAWHTAGNEFTVFSPLTKQFVQPLLHYETPESKRRCYSLLAVTGLLNSLVRVPARPATTAEVLRCHTVEHVKEVEKASALLAGASIGEEAVASNSTYAIALLAAGGAITAVDAVLDGKLDNAYVLARPPGHHATPTAPMGFCYFNNVAIAAKHALETRPKEIQRVAIVDYDVHHGNGTQEIFYSNPNVLFISVHQQLLYPKNSGTVEEVGEGKGKGFNINLPLPPGSGIGAYEAAFNRVICPALVKFNPQLILVSSGVDACSLDPLSHMMLPSSSYQFFAKSLLRVAKETAANGRIVFVHEGGYSEFYAPFCVHRIVEALLGVAEPIASPSSEPASSGSVSTNHEHKFIIPEDPMENEIRTYGGQSLQPAQNALIAEYQALFASPN